MNKSEHKRILLFAYKQDSCASQELWQGLYDYKEASNWMVSMVDSTQDPLPIIRSQHHDGVILRLDQPKKGLLRELRKMDVPYVVYINRLGRSAPHISFNDYAVGEAAANYLLECGFRNFAFIESKYTTSNDQRYQGYAKTLQAQGYKAHAWLDDVSLSPWVNERSAKDHESIIQWLQSLPKPCALLSSNEWAGFTVINCCKLCGLRVPEDVAVLGVGNEGTIYDFGFKTLSSIMLPYRALGKRAAELMDQAISGKPAEENQVVLDSFRLVPKQSTDICLIEDRLVAKSVQFIRQTISQPIKVSDLLDELKVSRSSLEAHFKESLGRTPHDEIVRQKMAFAEDLLMTTDLPVELISEHCGYINAKHFSSSFKRLVGQTPRGFRESRKGRDSLG